MSTSAATVASGKCGDGNNQRTLPAGDYQFQMSANSNATGAYMLHMTNTGA